MSDDSSNLGMGHASLEFETVMMNDSNAGKDPIEPSDPASLANPHEEAKGALFEQSVLDW